MATGKKRILAKQMDKVELEQIADEWSDSATVTSLLAHVQYLEDIIAAGRAIGGEEKKSGTDNNTD